MLMVSRVIMVPSVVRIEMPGDLCHHFGCSLRHSSIDPNFKRACNAGIVLSLVDAAWVGGMAKNLLCQLDTLLPKRAGSSMCIGICSNSISGR